MSRIQVTYGTAGVDIAAAYDELLISGRRTLMYNPQDLLTATAQALRAIGTSEADTFTDAVAEVGTAAHR